MLNPSLPLSDHFAEHTEIQMATLEVMRDRSRVSQRDIDRQQTIVDAMIEVCRTHKIRPGRRNGRLREVLENNGEG